MIEGYTDHYFHREILITHLDALKSGNIGNGIVEFIKSNKIECKKVTTLPEKVEGMFVQRPFRKGKILFGRKLNALILGHEGRHAWQLGTLSPNLQQPESAHEQVVFDRFIEADARAVHLGATFQMAASMGIENYYIEHVLDNLSDYEREIFKDDRKNIPQIVDSPSELKMAMRKAFDAHLIISLATDYDWQSMRRIERARTSKLARAFYIGIMGMGVFRPCYTSQEMDTDYPLKLAEHLGQLEGGWDGNYLLDTEGPELNSDFYTRICNYRLEEAIEELHA